MSLLLPRQPSVCTSRPHTRMAVEVMRPKAAVVIQPLQGCIDIQGK